MTVFEILLPAFVASLILTGIHSYLGVHVVERGVIFVDLSLAQIAALGGTVGVPRGVRDALARARTSFSLGFTLLGAAIFAFTKTHRKTRIPQEAIIGIVYAVSAALRRPRDVEGDARDRAPQGNARREHPLRLLARARQDGGALRARRGLSLRLPRAVPPDLARTRPRPSGAAGTCGSGTSSSTRRSGSSSRARSRSPGVLLVFSFLIVPSVAAMLFSERLGVAPRDRLDDGSRRVRRRRLALVHARPPDGCRDRRARSGRPS